MSYAHTKRRKTIARLKREEQREHKSVRLPWRERLQDIGEAVRRHNDGPLVGSLQQILDANRT